MPKSNPCCPHASLQLPPSVHPGSPRNQQLLPHATESCSVLGSCTTPAKACAAG